MTVSKQCCQSKHILNPIMQCLGYNICLKNDILIRRLIIIYTIIITIIINNLLLIIYTLSLTLSFLLFISLPSQPPPPSCPLQVRVCGRRQCWRTLRCSRGSGLRWRSSWRSGGPATCPHSCCRGSLAARRRTQVGTALSAAASEDAARPPHC